METKAKTAGSNKKQGSVKVKDARKAVESVKFSKFSPSWVMFW